jgi:hypothetical protein
MQLLQLVSGETKKLWARPRQIKVHHFQKQASKGYGGQVFLVYLVQWPKISNYCYYW